MNISGVALSRIVFTSRAEGSMTNESTLIPRTDNAESINVDRIYELHQKLILLAVKNPSDFVSFAETLDQISEVFSIFLENHQDSMNKLLKQCEKMTEIKDMFSELSKVEKKAMLYINAMIIKNPKENHSIQATVKDPNNRQSSEVPSVTFASDMVWLIATLKKTLIEIYDSFISDLSSYQSLSPEEKNFAANKLRKSKLIKNLSISIKEKMDLALPVFKQRVELLDQAIGSKAETHTRNPNVMFLNPLSSSTDLPGNCIEKLEKYFLSLGAIEIIKQPDSVVIRLQSNDPQDSLVELLKNYDIKKKKGNKNHTCVLRAIDIVSLYSVLSVQKLL